MPPISWASIPKKGQLAILTSVRVVDFFQVASLQACMYKHLESFSTSSAPSNTISVQIGSIQGAFTAAQVISAICWGRVSDAVGRKPVLIIGLLGISISNIGVAFSKSYEALLIWRIIAGGVNGTAGATRATLSEALPRDYHARAFLVLPLAFNIASILGPISGALLTHPTERFPGLFGPNSVLGGVEGVSWMLRYPYAPPNILCSLLLLLDAIVIWLCLKETAPNRRPVQDYDFQSIRSRLKRLYDRRRGYTMLSSTDDSYSARHSDDERDHATTFNISDPEMVTKNRVSLRLVWNRAFLLILLTTVVFELHLGGLASLWPVYVSSPHRKEKDPTALPFYFTGGLGLNFSQAGLALAILGILGLAAQLVLYPRVVSRYRLVHSFRASLWLYPAAYFLTPFLSLLRAESTGTIWLGIFASQSAQVVGRTFALPATILLLNHSCPHPSLLGSVHGLGSAAAGASRTLGSIMAGYLNSVGLVYEMSGLAWWIFALFSLAGSLFALTVSDNLGE